MPSRTKVVIVFPKVGSKCKNFFFRKMFVSLNFSTGRFESYDYGPANFDHYGQKLPITYDLSKVLALQCFPLTCGSFWPFVEIFDYYFQLPMICWGNLLNNVCQVTAPTAIFKGDADSLTALEDINRLVRCKSASERVLVEYNQIMTS